MARLYALTGGIDQVETTARLRAVAGETVSENGPDGSLPAYRNHNALTDAIACAELYLALTADTVR